MLRTGFIPNRKLWIEDDIADNNGEWKITQAWYDVTNNETVIVVDGTLVDSLGTGASVKIYGYETGGGFDGLNECSEPQPFNINTIISEYLQITVDDEPLPVGT